MRVMALLPALLLSSECMALTLIYDGPQSTSAYQYIKPVLAQKEGQERPGSQSTPGIPAKSAIQAGAFDSYQLPGCQKFPNPFFVVGADDFSMDWLKSHASHLKETRALGFITNINAQNEFEKVQALSPVSLMPVVVDVLVDLIKAPAYPFFTNGCEVWQ